MITIENIIKYHDIKPGDTIFVPPYFYGLASPYMAYTGEDQRGSQFLVRKQTGIQRLTHSDLSRYVAESPDGRINRLLVSGPNRVQIVRLLKSNPSVDNFFLLLKHTQDFANKSGQSNKKRSGSSDGSTAAALIVGGALIGLALWLLSKDDD
jgi:hypothetical protein